MAHALLGQNYKEAVLELNASDDRCEQCVEATGLLVYWSEQYKLVHGSGAAVHSVPGPCISTGGAVQPHAVVIYGCGDFRDAKARHFRHPTSMAVRMIAVRWALRRGTKAEAAVRVPVQPAPNTRRHACRNLLARTPAHPMRCRGIDVVRNKIKMFAQKKVTLPPGRHKVVILDEADRWGRRRGCL